MERERYLELLERRLALLGDLAESLRASTAALVGMDLERIDQKVGEQENLCLEIQSLDRGLDDLQKRCSTGLAPGSEPAAVLARMADAQAEVRALNRKHAALVRRSRRTLDAMLNFLHSASDTYTDPGRANSRAGGRS